LKKPLKIFLQGGGVLTEMLEQLLSAQNYENGLIGRSCDPFKVEMRQGY
jgi:hypothetical protein